MIIGPTIILEDLRAGRRRTRTLVVRAVVAHRQASMPQHSSPYNATAPQFGANRGRAMGILVALEVNDMTPPNNNPYGIPPSPSHPSPPQHHGQQYGQQYGNPQAQQGFPPPPQPGQGFNPYAPPTADLQGQWAPAFDANEPLAERGTRLVAHIIDNGLYGVTLGVWSVPAAVLGFPEFIVGLGGLVTLALFAYQTFLLSTTGQSLGKKWLKIRIVKLDGSPVDFVSAVLLRSWAFAAIAMVGSFLFIGAALPLIDALLIFGDERRCLHDHLASTKVVVAR